MGDIKPFLRWAGSKRQLVPRLSEFWSHSYERYVEPFAGSACLFFHLQPSQAILGDINQGLIRAYEQVRDNFAEVNELLRGASGSKSNYLHVRDIPPAALSPAEQAAQFIYLNRFCFNGLYRTNLTGKFNVPYGGLKSGSLPSPEMLSACATALKNTQLVAGDFENILKLVQPGDFVYLDPPYRVKAKRVFNSYNGASFTQSDLKRLRGWLEIFASQGIAFLVSYIESEESSFLQSGFKTMTVNVR